MMKISKLFPLTNYLNSAMVRHDSLRDSAHALITDTQEVHYIQIFERTRQGLVIDIRDRRCHQISMAMAVVPNPWFC